MTKIMVMEVNGLAIGLLKLKRFYRIVAVDDLEEFTKNVRAAILLRIKDDKNAKFLTDSQQATLLKNISIRFVDTGLTEYPETEAEQAALYDKHVFSVECGEVPQEKEDTLVTT